MLAALTTTPAISPSRKRLTRADCAVLEMSGQLDHQKVELIDGDLIEKMPKNWPHVHALSILQYWLIQVFGLQFVAPEAPVNVLPEDNPTNEPQPDIVVLNRPSKEFKGSAKPSPEELRLVVEISDTTLRFDTTVKAALYARASIAEYWVLDINSRRLGVYLDPRQGAYQSITWYGENESVAPSAAEESRFVIASSFS
jgi:Uma2 family endonuclease